MVSVSHKSIFNLFSIGTALLPPPLICLLWIKLYLSLSFFIGWEGSKVQTAVCHGFPSCIHFTGQYGVYYSAISSILEFLQIGLYLTCYVFREIETLLTILVFHCRIKLWWNCWQQVTRNLLEQLQQEPSANLSQKGLC